MALKEILSELNSSCSQAANGRGVNKAAPTPNFPSWWSTDVINRINSLAGREEMIQRSQSHVRNDELPLDDEAYAATVKDYGDVRSGDDTGMRGYGGYSDGPQSGEYEEQQEDEVSADDETPPEDEITDDEIDDQYGASDPDGENEFTDDVEEEWDDPDLQGVIRTVPSAHLIYKRQQEDGTFNELWQYNIGKDFRKELEIRRSILAGTDIPPNKMASPDDTQTFELWTAGNAQVMHIRGLPN